VFESLARLADTVGDEAHRGHVHSYLARVEIQAGRYELARRLAREALPQEPGQPLAVALWVLATAEAYLGRVEDARAAAAESLRLLQQAGDRWVQLAVTGLLGFLELSLGNAAGAAGLLRPLWPAEKELGRREPALCQELPNAIHALLELGELEEARPLIDELEQCGRAVDNAWSLAQACRLRGLLAAAQGEVGTALAHFEAALHEHERLPVPFEHARTLLALGATLRRARRKAAARETLEQALATFEDLGAPLWVERAREELARISGRRSAGSELTETEQRIARLVAEGRSNKEVAAALYVTVRTVESNLTRIYAKLGIHSRTELARRVS
jgi:ATP/maltotriose-dependent transcriptional regulator MalT